MGLFGSWAAWRQFKRLSDDWRNIVFYAESGQDWHHFQPIIHELIGRLQRRVVYVSSDPGDAGLQLRDDRFHALCIEEGWFRTLFFQVCRADVFVLTMMDLHNLDLKRSLHPVHYIYLFHGMGSTHMVDFENSYDHYDSIFCAGPHQMHEIRRREALKALPAKQLFEHGYHRLETLLEAAQTRNRHYSQGDTPTILIAPTWGDDAIFNRVGEPLIRTLLEAGFKVIMRPHYHTIRLTPELISGLVNAFKDHSGFEYVDRMGESESLFRSHLLVCDWSAMAVEYALGLEKPVLFIDLPRRIRNPNWRELDIEPIESAIRPQVGAILDLADIDAAPALIRRLLENPDAFRAQIRSLREERVFNLGRSVPVAAEEIARIAIQQTGFGSAGRTREGGTVG